MSRHTGPWGIIFFLPATLAIILACSISVPTPNNPPAYDPTVAALEFQATAMSLQLTQAAVGAQAVPTQPPPIQPTVSSEPLPTLPSSTAAATPVAEAQRFFTEDFNTDVINWTTFLTSGQKSVLEQYVENGFWVFDLGGRDMYVYSLYEPEIYGDVRIDLRAENRGDNTNNISIICRYDEKGGWYEFNMYNSGLYDIFYGRWKSSGTQASYTLLEDGGSNAIHQGKTSNEYTVICSGSTLSLFINGQETRSVNESLFKLHEGKVGIGASSFDRLPIRVDFDWVKISEP